MKIVSLNIASASERRAEAIITWLKGSQADLVVMSETSNGPGTRRIARAFLELGWYGQLGETTGNERGAAIYGRWPMQTTDRPQADPLPARAMTVTVDGFDLYGFYIPNRGNDATKLRRKTEFLDAWGKWLVDKGRERPSLVIGDLNIVPASQHPAMLPQMKFEYDWIQRLRSVYSDLAESRLGAHEFTWVAHTGEGYTYDHAFASRGLAPRVVAFEYDHSSRSKEASDHSALTVDIHSTIRSQCRPISDLGTWQAQDGLF